MSKGRDETELVSWWRELLTQHAKVWCELDRRLHAEHGLTASAFEALDRLAETEHHKLRIQELSDEIHLSQSALSRLVAHLEKNGLVERAMCANDRRGVYVKLTQAGITKHRTAVATHREILASRAPIDA